MPGGIRYDHQVLRFFAKSATRNLTAEDKQIFFYKVRDDYDVLVAAVQNYLEVRALEAFETLGIIVEIDPTDIVSHRQIVDYYRVYYREELKSLPKENPFRR